MAKNEYGILSVSEELIKFFGRIPPIVGSGFPFQSFTPLCSVKGFPLLPIAIGTLTKVYSKVEV
jgi:hypothetical protein